MMPDNTIWVILPCYNVSGLCVEVIRKIKKYSSNIIAIDDGSTDDTAEVLASAAITVLTHPSNRGKGSALRSGIQYILGEKKQLPCAVTIDADGQHDADLLPLLTAPVINGQADLTIGARRFNYKEMPFKRWAANKVSSSIISLCLGKKIHDIQSGYRVYSMDLLRNIAGRIESSGFEIETEMLILSLKSQAKILEIPVPSLYSEESGKNSKWRPFSDSYRIARTVVKNFRK